MQKGIGYSLDDSIVVKKKKKEEEEKNIVLFVLLSLLLLLFFSSEGYIFVIVLRCGTRSFRSMNGCHAVCVTFVTLV